MGRWLYKGVVVDSLSPAGIRLTRDNVSAETVDDQLTRPALIRQASSGCVAALP